MATGYFKRVFDTEISGNELSSNLSGNDVRQLMFSAAMVAPNATLTTTVAGLALTGENLLQASINSLGLNNSLALAVTGTSITVGPDAASQAAAYIQFFNLRSTNDVRALRFLQTVAPAATGICSLANTSGTHANINIQLNGSGATDAATQQLFAAGVRPGFTGPLGVAGDTSGIERIVLVNASTLTSGSEVMNFNILTGSL